MFGRCFVNAVAFIAFVFPPPLLECTTECQEGNPSDYVEGRCPVKLTPVPQQDPVGYSECVIVRVLMKKDDIFKLPRIEILSSNTQIIRPMKRKSKKKDNNESQPHETQVRCRRVGRKQVPQRNTSFVAWELVHDCVTTEAGSVVFVSYSSTAESCNVSYTVADPVPDFSLSVDPSSNSVTVTVEPGAKVNARWCYQKTPAYCQGGEGSSLITIDPSRNRSAVLNMPYLLPCISVEVYYTYTDARRHKRFPFENQNLTDVWRSSKVSLYESSLTWNPLCPASGLRISAALCWRHHQHLCTPVVNSTLEEKDGGQHLIYDTSAVDRHPQMCVQFSSQGSHHISCPFHADMSSWEVYFRPGGQSLVLYITSIVPAKFSAQLCVLSEGECRSMGEVHSAAMAGNTTEARISVPLYSLDEKPCVQVWQSDPFLHGRRILCPEYTNNRGGIYAVVVLIIVFTAALLGTFIHRLTKSGDTGWLCIQRPVLLVCSSEHLVSAVCALASILQEELKATVNMALWSLSLQTSGVQTGVADLGPLPWLYGQWEAVVKAQGKVLIVWSPEANKTYQGWREERAGVDKKEGKKEDHSNAKVRHETVVTEVEDGLDPSGKMPKKSVKEKAEGKKDFCKLCADIDWYPPGEPSTVIAPVFKAALACLEGALQGFKGQGVVLVYFQGLCHRRDIPKALRCVPRYCLPQDFKGLIEELGGMRQTKPGKYNARHCWPRLLSKVLTSWLAWQLAQRLQTLLPQGEGQKKQRPSVKSSRGTMADRTQNSLRFPTAANTARPGTVQEHEPLHGSPWREGEIKSQVSHI